MPSQRDEVGGSCELARTRKLPAGESSKLAVDIRRRFDTLPAFKLRTEPRFMPNTKSAERRMRNSARKKLQNRSVKSRLKTLERAYAEALKGGKKDTATDAYRKLSSAFDKAAKSGVIHKSKASRRKSRLAVKLTATK